MLAAQGYDLGGIVRLRTFFAETGDCLLLTSNDGKHVLVDGGPSGHNFDEHVLKTLQAIRSGRRGEKLDLVIITHIDDDHIDGILHMLELYEAQGRSGEPSGLPKIVAIWHNSWTQYRARPPRRSPHARCGPGARIAPPALLRKVSLRFSNLQSLAANIDFSPAESAEVSRHVVLGRRPIRLNVGFRGSFVELTAPPRTRHIGRTLELTVLGPSPHAIDELREVFANKGLANTPIRNGILTPRTALNTLTADRTALTFIARHEMATTGDVGDSVRDPRDIRDGIGDDSKVTTENRASIIVLATESDPGTGAEATCLLTGDATAQDVLRGLTLAGRLDGERSQFHCDILKIQHHGAEFNFSNEFAERVIARDYVLSANGQHSNPDTNVVRVMIERRAETKMPFTVWFTCAESGAPHGSKSAMQEALAEAIRAAEAANRRTPDLVTIRVLNDGTDFFDICTCRSVGSSSCDCPSADTTTTVVVPRPNQRT